MLNLAKARNRTLGLKKKLGAQPFHIRCSCCPPKVLVFQEHCALPWISRITIHCPYPRIHPSGIVRQMLFYQLSNNLYLKLPLHPNMVSPTSSSVPSVANLNIARESVAHTSQESWFGDWKVSCLLMGGLSNFLTLLPEKKRKHTYAHRYQV